MSKLTVADAAKKLGVSREAIHNRIRRGSLECVVENGVKLVVIDVKNVKKAPTRANSTRKVAPAQVDERYYKLLEEHNQKLQKKIDTLENETRSLRDQKEQMLIDERKKIEQIYKEKDEQLKNVLNAISSKFMLNAPKEDREELENIVEAEVQDEPSRDNKLISLNKYLKSKNFSNKKITKIKEKFKKRAKADSRIITIGKKFYIDLDKYDYSDLSL